MVNKNIVDYLIEGQKRGFSLNVLKQKLLEHGFSERDISDSINSMNYSSNISFPTQEKSGIKWMKIAGILGIIYLIISVLYLIISFIPSFPKINNTAMLIFLSIIIISSLFYYSGFIRLGRRTGSKQISFYAWAMIILIIAVILFVVFASSYLSAFVSQAIGPSQGFTTPKSSSSNPVLAWVILGIFIALFLFYFIVQILFCVGLIKIKDKVRFSKGAGILNLIYIIISIITTLIYVILILTNPLLIASIFFALFMGQYPGILIAFIVAAVVIYLLKILASLLTSFTLFDASKKFE